MEKITRTKSLHNVILKAVPLHKRAWEERYSSNSVSVLGGGEWSASSPGRALAQGKGPRYPLYRRLGGPQSWSGNRSYRKNPFASAKDRTSITQLSSPHPDTILTELPGSHYVILVNKFERTKTIMPYHQGLLKTEKG
jgi:hypothetical protein